MFEISGKVALVTGGASGIGLAVARELLANGAKGVVIADNNQKAGETALKKLSGEFGKEKVLFVLTDVSNRKSFEDAFKRTLVQFKNIDILVNNAGIANEADYEKEIAINLTGATHGVMLALETYIAKHRTGSEGVIINTSSLAGTAVFPVCSIYGATKSGIVSLTMSLGHRMHYDRTNIKVVAIAPGYTDTNIFNNIGHRNEIDQALLEKIMGMQEAQSAEFVANNMIKIIKEKPSGTVWIVEGNKEAYEYIQPENPMLKIEPKYTG